MIWTKTDDGDGPKWISGIYKIVQYEYDHQYHLARHYRAYYIKKGDRYWGWYVDHATPSYSTLEAAQAACETHLKEHNVQTASR